MKRWLKWAIPLVAAGVVGGFVARAVIARKTEQAQLAAPSTMVAGLELAATDIVIARPVDLARQVEVSGGLRAVNSAFLKSRISGEVRALSAREGDTVKAGQLLGQLDTTEPALRLKQAEQSAAAARAQADIARRALDNNRALVAQGFISATGLETSVSNDAAAQANLQAALTAAQLAAKSVGDGRLVAPIGGQIAQRLVQPGERVSVDARLLEIVDLSSLELEASVAPDDVAGISVGQPALLQVDGLATPVPARVERINPSAQTGSRAVTVYLAMDGQPALRQGLYARGKIQLPPQMALAVPLSAVRTDQSLPYVLRLQDGRATAATVVLGRRGEVDGQPWVEVREGLQTGANVLTGTVGLVRDGTAITVAAAAAGRPASVAGAVQAVPTLPSPNSAASTPQP